MARNKHPEETVNRILDVALALFLEKGYDNTSIQDIIDGLGGLTKGAVYHHFKSKEDILSAALDRENAGLYAQLRQIRDDGRMNGAEKLQALFEASVMGPQMDLWANVAPDADPVRNARLLGMEYQALFEETVPFFVQPIVEQGVRDGSIRTDYPQEFSEVIVLVANLWVSPMFRASTAEQLRRRMDFYIDLVKALGLSLEENGLGEVLEDYRRRFHERFEAMAGKGGAEGALQGSN
ncbi:TetR family transcriptional regulator [Gordonibacter sp. An230]|uniref:TetR/AcrR family transcriptional regulator n=1 Tax=Gordonibacter sp. An230 TaxID=1965592 RepID=UPI000B390EB5|nr:TetR/AcrR family transcriptional regulator [Gordonibacter sp. An230]OUO86300.1 TetR family transcriptional regulator [Gordonibacter sp. An230]